MATLDSSIVNIALPTLTQELGADLYRVKWVVLVYLFVITSLLLPFGRLSDLYGRKRVFHFGFLVFILGSLLCSLSSSLGWLVFFRAFQAVGASMLMVNGPAIIVSSFLATERGKALGTLAMVVSAGLISGPSIGGILISQLGWKSIFWVNIPIGIIGMIMVYRFVAADPPLAKKGRFDWIGAFIQAVVLLLFMSIFDPPHISVSGSSPLVPSRLLFALLTIIFGIVFVRVEASEKAPLFDLSLLKNQTFWAGNLAGFLTFVAFSSVSVLMPFFLEQVMGFPPHTAGLFMSSIPLTVFVVAPVSGRLSDRVGSQELSFAGALVGAAGLFIMAGAFGAGMHREISDAGIVLVLCAIGLAMGLFQSPNNNAIMSSVPQEKLGVASALVATVRNLGLITGTGLATALFTWRMNETGDFVSSLHLTHFVAGLISIGAMLASLAKERGPVKPST